MQTNRHDLTSSAVNRSIALALIASAACSTALADDVSRRDLRHPDDSDWIMDGRTYDAQRYSPLTLINEDNVAELGLAWYHDLHTYRGVEATPLVVDGVLYNISAWNLTTAHDAATGEVLWEYDPEVPREWGRYACCEPVSRGLAAWRDSIIIATLDGRLIALDAATGEPRWSVQTFEKTQPYSITGAPRVFDGKVLIGNGGADMGVRGFVSAYDADDGELLWTFYTVPANPADGFENEAMAMAAETWTGEWWTLGGGGTAWDSIAYDRERNLIFIGTGNGSPLVRYFRSPGGGDNLFLCSIVAVDADTGEYRWHYQAAPGEEWDYTCTQSMIQADLVIDDEERAVLMQAPKNGFFYVLDRETGELISAENFVAVNWASRVDLETGRPAENTEIARFDTEPSLITPGPGGGHNWYPMAFNPETGFAYFPFYEHWFVHARDETFTPVPFRSNSGWGGYTGEALQKRLELQANMPPERAGLVAWDPVRQQAAWEVPLPRHGNGGVLTTAANLVVAGTTKQTFSIFRATDGELLWEMPVQSSPVAAPITYVVDGEQYLAVNAGFGGGAAQVERSIGQNMHRAEARLLVFKLGGGLALPPLPDAPPPVEPPPLRADEATVARGAQVFAQTCAECHGQLAIGGVKDLRFMTPETHAAFNEIVLEGTLLELGMASFSDILTAQDAEDVHAYLIARANEDWGRE
ncbi:MAG: PQQ-dependent dehydrogenase, methanol/ethanol family [Gammaproteobacteria bacterium]|jgi:quinohemoprotein ethanol dehydrogenase